MLRTTRDRDRRRPWWRGLLGLLLITFLALNALAWVQARAATTFVAAGAPLEALITQPLPQQLGALLTGVRIPRPENHATPADHYLPYETRTIET